MLLADRKLCLQWKVLLKEMVFPRVMDKTEEKGYFYVSTSWPVSDPVAYFVVNSSLILKMMRYIAIYTHS